MKVRNTSGDIMMIPSVDGIIEAQEAAGQAALVASESLPVDMHDRETFEALGFEFGAPYPDDKLFLPAKLPAGWSKRPTDHSMWSDIVDDKGRVRVGVFYKAAFYDRKAHMSLRGRYSVRPEYARDYSRVHVDVCDGDELIYSTETFTGDERACFAAEDRQRAEACAWLDANRPGWRDPIKQWEEEAT